MKKEKLTPEAQEIVTRFEARKNCFMCDGRGVVFTQPYGIKQICSTCRGTGKKTDLFYL